MSEADGGRVYCGPSCFSAIPKRKDAVLMAAAPELYAMLRQIVLDKTSGETYLETMARVGLEFQELAKKIEEE